MYTFFKLMLALAVMVSIIPLAVWGGSGSKKVAWEALKAYLKIMGGLTLAGAFIAGAILLGGI
ncbi:hypothetical protein ACFDR9_001673 [Janthinobacterium sp. CG_23.3]|uniref:hypothetical protein n=1 Tax=unclassified Janthinobacterium TaxID=2610881 RepID=UPI002DF800DC|nr:hypothetical protein [Janthinobacterium sp. CG_S6]